MATVLEYPVEDLKEANSAGWMELISTARCPRCGGLMVPEQCFDLRDDTGHLDFLARRCVQCGDLVDPLILRNRHLRSLGAPMKSAKGSKSSVC